MALIFTALTCLKTVVTRLTFSILAIAMLWPALPWAQSVPQAEPTVNTVTGQATPVSATSASVVVVTRQVIEDSRAENVADVLRQVPLDRKSTRLKSSH